MLAMHGGETGLLFEIAGKAIEMELISQALSPTDITWWPVLPHDPARVTADMQSDSTRQDSEAPRAPSTPPRVHSPDSPTPVVPGSILLR